MRFRMVFTKALIAISPLILLGCGSDGGSNKTADTAASTPTATVAAPISTNEAAPVIAPTPIVVTAPPAIAPTTITVSTPEMTPTLLDTQDLTQRLSTLCSIMNLGATLNASALDDLFIPDPNYGTSSDLTRAQDIASIVAIFGPNGTNSNGRLRSIGNVRIVSDQTSNYTNRGVSKAYLLNYDFFFENGTVVRGSDVTFGKDLNDGKWKFIGGPNGSDLGNNYGYVVTVSVTVPTSTIIDTPVSPPVAYTGP